MSSLRGKIFHKKRRILEIFKRFSAHNPHPTTELIYHSHFELLVAVILSAQATDQSVNRATEKLFKIANTPQAFLQLGYEKLLEYIRSIGLCRSKAKHLIQMSEDLIKYHHSQIPRQREDLEKLSGVGRKTANVILNTVFGEPVIAVDTHIFRVAQRLNLSKGKTPLAIEQQLMKIIPAQYIQNAHHWLILHGRYICKARSPMCEKCFLNDLCDWKGKQILVFKL